MKSCLIFTSIALLLTLSTPHPLGPSTTTLCPFVPKDLNPESSSGPDDPGVVRMVERLLKVQSVLRKSVMSLILRLDGKWASDYLDFQDLHDSIAKIGDSIKTVRCRATPKCGQADNATVGQNVTALVQIGGLVRSLEALKEQFSHLFDNFQRKLGAVVITPKPAPITTTPITTTTTEMANCSCQNKNGSHDHDHEKNPPTPHDTPQPPHTPTPLPQTPPPTPSTTPPPQTPPQPIPNAGEVAAKTSGRLCNAVCPAATDLVCGTDGRTFNNLCELNMDSCLSDITHTVLRPLIYGPCGGKCDNGFVMIDKNCYFFRLPNGTHDVVEAIDACAAMNSRLVAIETQEEFDKLRKMANVLMPGALADGNNFWTSARGVGDPGKSIWIWSTTGERLKIPDAWMGPPPYGRLTCAVLYGYLSYQLLDVSCSPHNLRESYGWICERVYETD